MSVLQRQVRDGSTGASLPPSVERPYAERAEGTHEQVENRATVVTIGIRDLSQQLDLASPPLRGWLRPTVGRSSAPQRPPPNLTIDATP